jgi:hypothetical protein
VLEVGAIEAVLFTITTKTKVILSRFVTVPYSIVQPTWTWLLKRKLAEASYLSGVDFCGNIGTCCTSWNISFVSPLLAGSAWEGYCSWGAGVMRFSIPSRPLMCVYACVWRHTHVYHCTFIRMLWLSLFHGLALRISVGICNSELLFCKTYAFGTRNQDTAAWLDAPVSLCPRILITTDTVNFDKNMFWWYLIWSFISQMSFSLPYCFS